MARSWISSKSNNRNVGAINGFYSIWNSIFGLKCHGCLFLPPLQVVVGNYVLPKNLKKSFISRMIRLPSVAWCGLSRSKVICIVPQ
jgi:hypothetical protein